MNFCDVCRMMTYEEAKASGKASEMLLNQLQTDTAPYIQDYIVLSVHSNRYLIQGLTDEKMYYVPTWLMIKKDTQDEWENLLS